MANYNVDCRVGLGKGQTAVFEVNGNAAGVGTTSSNPLDVNSGDTITFRRTTNSGGDAQVSQLNNFTNNANMVLTVSAPNVTRTTSTTGLDTVKLVNAGGNGNRTDYYYINVQSSNSGPNAFNIPNITNASLSTQYESSSVQITGITGTLTASVSGQGSPQLEVNNNGTWTTSASITNNQYLKIRLTSPSGNSQSHTATVTVGGQSDTVTITTIPTSGQGTDTGSANAAYGLEVYDVNGSTKVLSPSTRYITLMQEPSAVTISAGVQTTVLQNMTGLTTSNSTLTFLDWANLVVTVSRVSNGFRLTNSFSSGSYTVYPLIVRF
jgi:hypothetical protein